MHIIIKGHNSVNVGYEVTVLFFCTSADHGLHLYQVCRKYLKRFQSYKETRFQFLLLHRVIIP